MKRYLILALLVLALAACGSDTTTQPTASAPTVQATWSDGALQVFHSTNYQAVGGYSDSFTVPTLWRLKWFCQPSSDPTQAFLGIDVQHAGDLSNADGETPLRADCSQTQNGFTEEHVSGSVTLQILAGTGTGWDVYVQVPQS